MKKMIFVLANLVCAMSFANGGSGDVGNAGTLSIELQSHISENGFVASFGNHTNWRINVPTRNFEIRCESAQSMQLIKKSVEMLQPIREKIKEHIANTSPERLFNMVKDRTRKDLWTVEKALYAIDGTDGVYGELGDTVIISRIQGLYKTKVAYDVNDEVSLKGTILESLVAPMIPGSWGFNSYVTAKTITDRLQISSQYLTTQVAVPDDCKMYRKGAYYSPYESF